MLHGFGFSPASRGLSGGGGGSVPVISAVNHGYIDTIGGGQPVVVTVDNSAGVTAVSFKGGAGTSVTIVDPTHVSAIPAAVAAGVGDVVVTNASGPSTTGGGLIEYFDPTSLVDLYLDGTQYDASTGTWTARKGVNFTQATAGYRPAAGAALGGRQTVDFDGSDDSVLQSSGTTADYVAGAAFWTFALANATAVSTDYSSGALMTWNNTIWAGTSSYVGFVLRSVPLVGLLAYSGSVFGADWSSFAVGAWQGLLGKRGGGKLFTRLGAGSWSAGTTIGFSYVGDAIRIGKGAAAASRFDGLMAVVAIGKTVPSDADITKFLGVIQQQWGVAL